MGNNTFPFSGFLSHASESGAEPKAYLNYLVFDRNYILKTGGFKRVPLSAKETGNVGSSHQKLSFDGVDQIKITEPGYVYIWLSNENETAVEVYFDDFKVTHTKSPVISTDEYYAGGAVFNSYTRENSAINSVKFQETEWQEELALNLYDFDARYYDPFTWRTPTLDPHAEYYPQISPYSFLNDNPVAFLDPTGMDAMELNGGSSLAICPTCDSNNPDHKPYIDDPNNTYHYDPNSGNVSLLLDEVVVNADKSEDAAAVPLVLPFTWGEIMGGVKVAGVAAGTTAAMTAAFVFVPTSTGDGEMKMLAKMHQEQNEEFMKRLQAKYIPAPKTLPGFPGAQRARQKGGRARWKDSNGDILEWDSQHGEVEVYDKRGRHKGVADKETGKMIKDPVPGRTTEP